LSKREVEILCKVAEGKTTSEIAENFNITITTVSTHRKNVLAKLELKNAAQLTYYAIQNGYVKV